MTEEANGNQQAASTENGAKPPEIDYEAKYKEPSPFPRMGETRQGQQDSRRRTATAQGAQLSEAEKTAKHIKELEAKNAAYEAEKQQNEWKTQVSKETGVPIALLHGSTLEEMQANGKALADYIAEKTKPKVHASSESNQPPAPSGSSGDWIRDQFLEQKQK